MDERWQRVGTTTSAYAHYANAYADKPDDRRWLQPLVDAFAALLNPGALVLDLGCASGRETVELQAAGLRQASAADARQRRCHRLGTRCDRAPASSAPPNILVDH